MTIDEQVALIERLKSMGAKRVKVGEWEIEFAEQSEMDMVQALDIAREEAKRELYAYLTEEQRAALDQKMEDALTYGSS